METGISKTMMSKDETTREQEINRVLDSKHANILAFAVCADDGHPVPLKFDPPVGWMNMTVPEVIRKMLAARHAERPRPGEMYPGKKMPPNWSSEKLTRYCSNIIPRPTEPKRIELK